MKRMTLRSAIAAIICSMSYAAVAYADPKPVNVPAGDLIVALETLAKQSSVEFVYQTDQLKGLRTQGVSGNLSPQDAVTKLLEGTPLKLHTDATGAILIAAPRAAGESKQKSVSPASTAVQGGATPKRFAQADTPPQAPTDDQPMTTVKLEEVVVRIPEVLVVGSKILNADIRRTEDDIQPYVVFEREDVRDSMAANLEEFLKTRLPMNSVSTTNSQQSSGQFGNQSQIDLRGLGTAQTLVLVNGRRMPSVSAIFSGGNFNQPDINGIPLSAVERIEILPSTASGIYGGGATGGVINIVLARDYKGIEVEAEHGNSFETDVSSHRLALNAGFPLEDGRTDVMLSAAYSDRNSLLAGERDFAARGRALWFRNDPASLAASFLHGRTTNIFSLDGDLVLDNGRSLGSPIATVPTGYAGPGSDNGDALAGTAGQLNLALANNDAGVTETLLTAVRTESFTLGVQRQFGDAVTAHLDFASFTNKSDARASGGAAYAFLPGDAPGNPFTNFIAAFYPQLLPVSSSMNESETLQAAAGIVWRLTDRWSINADYNWSRSKNSEDKPTVTFNRFAIEEDVADGDLDIFRDVNAFPIDYTSYLVSAVPFENGPFETELREAALRVAGPLFSVGGGPVVLTTSLQHREEKAAAGFTGYFSEFTSASINFDYFPSRSQRVSSLYTEAHVPLISSSNARSGLRLLDLQLAVRRDEYETSSVYSQTRIQLTSRTDPLPPFEYFQNDVASTDVTIGARFSPLDGLIFRTSFGTGFLPPSISQVAASEVLTSADVDDPGRGGYQFIDPIRITFGGSPELAPEESESWSAGVVYSPVQAPNLRVSLDYTRVKKTEEIVQLSSLTELIPFEGTSNNRLTRGPLEPNAPPEFTAGPIIAADLSLLNAASTEVEAYDLQLNYSWRPPQIGDIDVFLIGTWQKELERQVFQSSPLVDRVGFFDGPLEWRGNAGITWNRGAWTLTWLTQYFDSYRRYGSTWSPFEIEGAISRQGDAEIPSQTYHDLLVKYDFGERDGDWLRGMFSDMQVSLGIQNVLDQQPPTIATNSASSGYSSYADPRLRRYSMTLKKRF